MPLFGNGRSPQEDVQNERDATFANSVIKGTWRDNYPDPDEDDN